MTAAARTPGRPAKDGRRVSMILLNDTLDRLDAEAARLGVARTDVVDLLAAKHLPANDERPPTQRG